MLQNKNDFFCDRKVTLGTCFVRILFQHYTADLQTPDESRKDRAKIATLCLDGLSTAIHIVCHRFHDKLPEFLKDLGRLIHQLCRMTSFPPCLVFLELLCHKCKPNYTGTCGLNICLCEEWSPLIVGSSG